MQKTIRSRQKIKKRLDDIPRIQEEMEKEKERFIQSSGFKRVFGLSNETNFVVTKKMLGKKKLDELRKELADLEHVTKETRDHA